VAETSKTVNEALRLLLEVGARQGTIADLSRRLGLHRTVTQRLLASLREQGFVLRTSDGAFTLGVSIAELAARMDNPVPLVADKPMHHLARLLNETVVLALRDGDEAVSAMQIPATGRVVRVEYPTGFRHPLHLAATGRAILFASDPRTVERLVSGSEDGPRLAEQLDEDRRLGYSVAIDSLHSGAAGIAAPIIGVTGYAVASVGIAAPLDRFPEPEAISKPVMAAARAIGDALHA
jgi:DNA-binding IclR family transcriptional regulator